MRSHLRTVFILALTVALVAFFLRRADLGQVWREVRHASLGLVLLAMVINLCGYPIRAWRWRYLLAPIGPVRFWSALNSLFVGFGTSVILPARAGEFLRPYLLARWEQLSATSAFATVVLERVLDLIAVLLLLGTFLLSVDANSGPFGGGALGGVRAGGALAALSALGLLALLGVLAGHPSWLVRAVHRVERWLPAASGRLLPLVERFSLGLAAVRQPRRLLMALSLSLPLWVLIATGIWLTALAFHMTVPFIGSFLIAAILVIGVAVPTPGAIGGFHAAFQVAVTSFYGVPDDRAVGGAIVLHAISFLPVVLIAAAIMLHEGLSLGRMREMASAVSGSAETSGPPPGQPVGPVREIGDLP